MTENNEKLTFSACLVKQTKVWYKETLSGFGYIVAFVFCLLMIYFGYRIGAEFLIKNYSSAIASIPWYVYFVIELALLPFIAAFGDCISRHTDISADCFHMVSLVIAMIIYLVALIIPFEMGMDVSHADQGVMLMSIMAVPFILSTYGTELAFGTFQLLCDRTD